MDSPQRQHEATARQCLADTLAAVGLHAHAGPDRRELVLNDLVERALHAYEGFRRFEERSRAQEASGAVDYDAGLDATLRRTAQLHLEIGRGLVSQLDSAVLDRLTIRNAPTFRQSYASLVAREALDHGLLPPAMERLAEAARREADNGNAQVIDPDDRRNGVVSLRTWDFIKQTAGLSNGTQQLAEQRYRTFFTADDRHPALGGHPLVLPSRANRSGDPLLSLWSVEISFVHRAFAVLSETPDGPRRYVWFWIGSAEDCLALTA